MIISGLRLKTYPAIIHDDEPPRPEGWRIINRIHRLAARRPVRKPLRVWYRMDIKTFLLVETDMET